MIAAVDVQYEEGCGYAACVTFADWSASAATHEYRCRQDSVGEYQPGEFWKRELPCLVAVLALVEPSPQVIVIDGYVWLEDPNLTNLENHRDSNGRRRHE